VEAGSNVYSDALKSYDGLKQDFTHQVIDHAEAYVRGQVQVSQTILRQDADYFEDSPLPLGKWLTAVRFCPNLPAAGPQSSFGPEFDAAGRRVRRPRIVPTHGPHWVTPAKKSTACHVNRRQRRVTPALISISASSCEHSVGTAPGKGLAMQSCQLARHRGQRAGEPRLAVETIGQRSSSDQPLADFQMAAQMFEFDQGVPANAPVAFRTEEIRVGTSAWDWSEQGRGAAENRTDQYNQGRGIRSGPHARIRYGCSAKPR